MNEMQDIEYLHLPCFYLNSILCEAYVGPMGGCCKPTAQELKTIKCSTYLQKINHETFLLTDPPTVPPLY